jgi:hypothetical protein
VQPSDLSQLLCRRADLEAGIATSLPDPVPQRFRRPDPEPLPRSNDSFRSPQ